MNQTRVSTSKPEIKTSAYIRERHTSEENKVFNNETVEKFMLVCERNNRLLYFMHLFGVYRMVIFSRIMYMESVLINLVTILLRPLV